MSDTSVRSVPANRFERRKQRTREELVAAATRVLAEKGSSAKIADIAREADVGVGTFYLYFDTKEALYDALVEDAVARLEAAVDAARAGIDDPVAQTRAGTAALCRFAAENREVFKIVFGYYNTHPVWCTCINNPTTIPTISSIRWNHSKSHIGFK